MASTFPGAIDNFTDPLSNSPLNSPSHSALHSDLNDAVDKIETYMGLVKVIPTGATNGTVAANGTVTIGNAVSSVTVTCFSALYDNYLILANGGIGSTPSACTMRLGATATGYYSSGYNITYAGVGGIVTDNNATQWSRAMVCTSDGINGNISLNGPNLAKRTYISNNYIYGNPPGGGDASNQNGYLNDATQYTAFTIFFGVATMTGGTIRVYGYRN